MSAEFYKWLHVFAIMGLFLSLGAICFHVMKGGARSFAEKRFLMLTHGLALAVIFISGFGMMAKYKLGWDAWLYGKIVIWLMLGGVVAFIYRKPKQAKLFWYICFALGGLAGYLALFKPF